MPVPTYVKAVTAVASTLFNAAGTRDIVAPGAPLPLPDDDKLMLALWGLRPLDPSKVLLAQFIGMMVISIALIKLTAVFTNPEGTFLRRNLFLLFAVLDTAMAYLFVWHESTIKKFGATALPFAAALLLEALVFGVDGYARPRPVAAKKK